MILTTEQRQEIDRLLLEGKSVAEIADKYSACTRTLQRAWDRDRPGNRTLRAHKRYLLIRDILPVLLTHPISEAVKASKFRTSSAFYEAFHAEMGMTPTAYKRAYLENY